MRDELIEQTLQRVAHRITKQAITGVYFHSDKGAQYRSKNTHAICKQYGIVQSSGRVATCFDNAAAESFFATLEKELLQRNTFATHDQARQAIFAYIDGWYNTRRLHSTLGYRSPAQFAQLPESKRRSILATAREAAKKRREKRIEKIKSKSKAAKVTDTK